MRFYNILPFYISSWLIVVSEIDQCTGELEPYEIIAKTENNEISDTQNKIFLELFPVLKEISKYSCDVSKFKLNYHYKWLLEINVVSVVGNFKPFFTFQEMVTELMSQRTRKKWCKLISRNHVHMETKDELEDPRKSFRFAILCHRMLQERVLSCARLYVATNDSIKNNSLKKIVPLGCFESKKLKSPYTTRNRIR